MMKLLIVDDEYLVRLGLRETIDWNSYGLEIVGEAENGRQGLQMAEELKPDIVITDVKMPVMDGISLTKKLRATGFDGAIIIFSGYSDFEYARAAVENEVSAYILKPAENSELIEKIVGVKEKLLMRRKNSSIVESFKNNSELLKHKVLEDYLSGKNSGDVENRFRMFDLPMVKRGTLILCEGDTDCGYAEEQSEAVKYLFEQIVLRLNGTEITAGHKKNSFIIATTFIDIAFLKKQIHILLYDYEKKYRFVVSIAISDVFEYPTTIERMYTKTKKIIRNKPFQLINTVVTAGETAQPYKRLVTDIMHYISSHYAESLTVKSVAEALFVSDSHLMHLFKEETGKTFNEYLTVYRMIKAKNLLMLGKHRVNEIASMVGYNDEKYFGQVFKRHTGMTPKEFTKEGAL